MTDTPKPTMTREEAEAALFRLVENLLTGRAGIAVEPITPGMDLSGGYTIRLVADLKPQAPDGTPEAEEFRPSVVRLDGADFELQRPEYSAAALYEVFNVADDATLYIHDGVTNHPIGRGVGRVLVDHGMVFVTRVDLDKVETPG